MSKDYNLLFIFTDEQAQKTMKTYGNEIIKTPALDYLADNSYIFDGAYVTQPVCTPSRSTLLTGLYPHNTGCTKNNAPMKEDVKCFPEFDGSNDIYSGYIGKWHLGNEIFKQHGFDEWISIDDDYRKHYFGDVDKDIHSDYHNYLIEKGYKPDAKQSDGFKVFGRNFCTTLPEEDCKAAFVGKSTTKFLQDRSNDEKRFSLYVNFFEPHMPYNGPLTNLYDDIDLPENYNDVPDENSLLRHQLFHKSYERNGFEGVDLSKPEGYKEILKKYHGMVTQVDNQMKNIINTLKQTGLWENTIIVYTSDHGDMMGSHGILAKCVMYEESIKVPLLIRVPEKLDSGEKIKNPISQVDLVPTLLDYMNFDVPDDLDGKSHMNSLDNKVPMDDDVYVIWHGTDTGISSVSETIDRRSVNEIMQYPVYTILTSDGLKYNWCPEDKGELYNLIADPLERCNLAVDGKYSELIGTLQDKILGWRDDVGL